MSEHLTIGDLTEQHVGRPIYGIESIGGWERNLLLSSVAHEGDETRLMFRWNDDPSPANTRRGEFACGVERPSSTPCRLTTTPDPNDEPGARAEGESL